MKNEVPPAVMAGVIAVVVIIVVLIGYKFMSGSKNPSPSVADIQKGMAAHPGAYSGTPNSGGSQHRQGSPDHP